jgi:protein-disulfide isomerase
VITVRCRSTALRRTAAAGTITCIEDLRYVPFASAVTKAAFARGVTGTPTVLVNGRLVESSFSDPELLALAQG